MSKKFIKSPNLPKNNVRTVIIGENYCDLLKKPLNELGIKICALAENNNLPYPVRSHADMLMTYIGNGVFAAPEKTAGEIERRLELKAEIHVGKSEIKPQYPYDIAYNILQIGQKCFHNIPHTDSIVKLLLEKKGIDLINIRQGYSKCSVCVVSENAAITADKKLSNVLISNGIDTLLISEGFIDLDGYDYGFIGGSSGKIAPDKLAFTGRLDDHPDKDRIFVFLKKHGVEPIILTDRRIFDVGSIIPVIEEHLE